MQPASAHNLLDMLAGTRDPATRRAILDDSRLRLSVALIENVASRIRERLRQDPSRAELLTEVCFYLAEQLNDPLGWAHANRSRAYVFTNQKKCAAAEPLYEEAVRHFAAAGDERELGRTRIAQAENLTYLGDYRRAQGLAKEALHHLSRHGDADDLARVHIFAGNLFNRLNRYSEALAEYDEARRLLRDSSDYMVVAAVEMNRGSPLVELNRFDEALESLVAAREYCDRHSITVWSDILDRNIARLHRSLGRFSDALRSLNRARAHHEETGDVRRLALCDQASAEIYLKLNLFQDALELAQRAYTTFRNHSNPLEAAQCLCVIGAARLEMGDPAARDDFVEAMKVFREEGNSAGVASMNLQLGRLEQRAGDYLAARELARTAEEAYREAGLEVLAAYAQSIVAETLAADHLEEQAIGEAQTALARLSGCDARWVSYQSRNLLGTLYEGKGDSIEAERLYREALADVESLRGDIDLDEFRRSFGRDKFLVYENLAGLKADAGDLEEVFYLVERSKSRTMIDLLEQSTESVWQFESGDSRHAVQKLREELNGLYSRLAQAATARGRASPGLRDKIQEREQALLELLREAASRREPWAKLETRPSLRIEDLQEMLREDETLVEYCTIRNGFCAFVVDRRGFRFFRDLAPVTEVARSIEGLRFQLSKFQLSGEYLADRRELLLAGVRYHLQSLYRLLVAPLESRVASDSLVIVPHGVSHYVPFQALYDGESYLMDRYDLVYGASSTLLKICREKPEHKGPRDLVLAVPDEQTPAILEEARVLAGLLPDARVFVGDAATTDRLMEHGSSVGKLHIAAHGVFRSDNPMFSSLRLGDSWLNLVDVFNLRLGSELTTLSACETGMNALYGGDELLGLSQAFLYAGTPSLVVSLWRVNDRSTTLFMKRLYEELLKGTRKSQAVRAAALEVKDEYPHPYYWAPFILLGKS